MANVYGRAGFLGISKSTYQGIGFAIVVVTGIWGLVDVSMYHSIGTLFYMLPISFFGLVVNLINS